MKKRYILAILIFFLMFIGNVNAKIGDLIYEITKLNMQDTENGVKITFEGWAFIHLTNNFRGYFHEGKTEYSGAPDYEGGHEIMIVAEDESGNKTYLKNMLYDDGYSSSTAEKLRKYNFYYMQFYDKAGANVENEYYTNYNHLSGWKNANSCGMDTTSQCIYEDIGFHIEFFAENLSSDKNYTFKLYATNTDYNMKYTTSPEESNGTDGRKGKLEVLKHDEKNWAGSEIYFYDDDDVLTNSVSEDKAIITSVSSSKNEVYVTVHNGMPRKCWNGINNCTQVNGAIENTIFSLIGDKRIKDEDCNKEYKCGPGDYIINTKANGLNPGTESYVRIYRSWAVPAGKTTLQIKIEAKNDKKCEVSEPSGSKDMRCNVWTNLSSTCEELTVKEGNSSAVVKITQNGYISNIFKSNLVNTDTEYNANSYDGGWFQYAIVYRNEVSFTTKNLNGNIDDINKAMESRIKDLNTFNDNINLVISGLENITGTKLIKKCTQSGDFKNGDTLVTTCTFFLPSSLIDELGNVNYLQNENDADVTNKYYIGFDKSKYKLSVTLENLSRLDDNQAKNDSKNKKIWFGTWTVKTGCNLKVTNRLIETDGGSSKDGKIKYKFIYRPIDLKNPFPSRFPGVNWYNWYIVDKNKERLEEAYSKQDYYTILDNKTISEIKEYDKNHNYFGSVDEDFFKEYIKEGGS